jgi:hypothetical protein
MQFSGHLGFFFQSAIFLSGESPTILQKSANQLHREFHEICYPKVLLKFVHIFDEMGQQ